MKVFAPNMAIPYVPAHNGLEVEGLGDHAKLYLVEGIVKHELELTYEETWKLIHFLTKNISKQQEIKFGRH